MADQLCTTAQVKARLGVTDAVDDTVLSEMIDQLTSWIEGYTGRKLVPEPAATYTFDTIAGGVLRIPRGIRTVTSMGVATGHQPDAGGVYTTIPAGDILLRPKPEIASIGWPFFQVGISRAPTGTITHFGTYQNGATITGDYGFALTPPDIQSVAIDGVIAAYQNMSDGASSVIGADALAVAPWRDFFGIGSPQRKVLDSYRHWAIA
jgi:hypothetical protein